MRVVSQVPPLLSHPTVNILLVGKNNNFFFVIYKFIIFCMYRCGSGVVNVYDGSCLRTTRQPTPLKSLMHLTTTADQTLFNPTSEILAISSKRKKSALKLVGWIMCDYVYMCSSSCYILCKHVYDMCNYACQSIHFTLYMCMHILSSCKQFTSLW